MGIPGTPSISFSKDVIAYGGFTAEAVMAVVDGNASVENHLIVMN
jgi:hypothetical protein